MKTCIMTVSVYVFISMLLIGCCGSPMVITENKGYCKYVYQKALLHGKFKETSFEMFSNDWVVEKGDLKIHYTFCGESKKCPKGRLACLESKNGIKSLGTKFNFTNMEFHSIGGGRCTPTKNYSLIISLNHTKQEKNEPVLIPQADPCIYHISMPHPEYISHCSVALNGRLINFYDLTRTYNSTKNGHDFSIALCQPNNACDENVNVCEYKDKKQMAISLLSELKLYYNDEDKLYFKGHTFKKNSRKIDKRFELFLKCNWEKSSFSNTDIIFKENHPQGARYTFELETSHGCILKPVACMISDNEFIYNLSGLYNEHKKTWVAKYSGPERMFTMQMCGPVIRNANCGNPYAQICEKSNRIDFNRGSVMELLEFRDNVLTATINLGSHCNHSKDITYYKSFIHFYCDPMEHGPQYVREELCDTYFDWRTPHACPQLNATACLEGHLDIHSCEFLNAKKHYNLNALSTRQKSILDGDDEILLSVCGSIRDNEAPCMNDVSVALKKLKQINLRNRIVSLGKFSDYIFENGNLVLRYYTGALCDEGNDYSTSIHFICSTKEKEPVLLTRNNCHYQILWETRYGCPVCTVIDTLNNKSLDLSGLSQPSVSLDLFNRNITVDVCEMHYMNCSSVSQEDCDMMSFEQNRISVNHTVTTIERTLSTSCTKPESEFNRVVFSLTCDEIISMDRLISVRFADCTLMINYATSIVCPKEALKLKPHISIERKLNCVAESPFTKMAITLNQTVLKDLNNLTHCPKVTFNESLELIHLKYVSEDSCRNIPTKNITYETFLKCSQTKLNLFEGDPCLHHFDLYNEEYCKFFKQNKSTSVGLIIGLTLGLLIALIITGGLVYIFYIKRRQMYHRCSSSCYLRDSIL